MTPINLIRRIAKGGVEQRVSNEQVKCDLLDSSALGKIVPH